MIPRPTERPKSSFLSITRSLKPSPSKRRLIWSAALLVGVGQCANAQTLVVNGSFESPIVASPWYVRGVPTNWVQVGGGVDVTHNNYEVTFAAGAQSGVQFLDMNQAAGSVGGVYQDLAVSSGTTYQLSLYAASWRSDSYGTLSYRLINPGDSAVLASGSFTISSGETGVNGTAWSYLTLSATATSNNLRVQIEQFASSTAGLAVDNVALVAIPEPSVCAAFAGLAALGLAAWRRRN